MNLNNNCLGACRPLPTHPARTAHRLLAPCDQSQCHKFTLHPLCLWTTEYLAQKSSDVVVTDKLHCFCSVLFSCPCWHTSLPTLMLMAGGICLHGNSMASSAKRKSVLWCALLMQSLIYMYIYVCSPHHQTRWPNELSARYLFWCIVGFPTSRFKRWLSRTNNVKIDTFYLDRIFTHTRARVKCKPI